MIYNQIVNDPRGSLRGGQALRLPMGNDFKFSLFLREEALLLQPQEAPPRASAEEEEAGKAIYPLREAEDLEIKLVHKMTGKAFAPETRFMESGLLEVSFPSEEQMEGLWLIQLSFRTPEEQEKRYLEREAVRILPAGSLPRPSDSSRLSLEILALAKGRDGHTPRLQLKKHRNGLYFLTSDGEELTDEEGHRFYLVREALTPIDEPPYVQPSVAVQRLNTYFFNDPAPYRNGERQLGQLNYMAGVGQDWRGTSGITLPFSWVYYENKYQAGVRLELRPIPKQWVYDKMVGEGRKYRLGVRVWIRPGVEDAAIQLSGNEKISRLSGLSGGATYTLGLDVHKDMGLQEIFITAPYYDALGVSGFSLLDLRYYDITDLEEEA